MTRSSDLARIDRVNGIRKRRLAQALSDSRRAAALAQEEERRACERAERARQCQAEAHAAFLSRPSDVQAMLWRAVTMDKNQSAQADQGAALAEHQAAQADVRNHVQALNRHEVRSDTILQWGARARAEEARAADNRGDEEDGSGHRGTPL